MHLYIKKILAIVLILCFSMESFAQSKNDSKYGPTERMEQFAENPDREEIKKELKKPAMKKVLSAMNWAGRKVFGEYNQRKAIEKNKELTKRQMISLSKGQAEVAGHVASTMIMVSVVALYAGIREKRKIDNKYGIHNAMNDQDLWDKLTRALTSGHFWMGFLGSSASSTAVTLSTKMFSKIFGNPVSAGAFRKLLSSFAFSLGTLVAWETFGQLWEESRILLVEVEDYRNSENFFVMVKAFMDENADPKTRELSKKIFNNMFRIVFTDDDLRKQWFNNVFRLRLRTGDFLVMASLITGGAQLGGIVGTTIFPGGGTWVGTVFGTIFGIAFGMIAYELPQKEKDEITDQLKQMRKWDALGCINGTRYRIQTLTGQTKNPDCLGKIDILAMKAFSYLKSPENKEVYPRNIPTMAVILGDLDDLAVERSDYIGNLLEIISWYNMQIEDLNEKKELKRKTRRSTLSALALSELDGDIRKLNARIEGYIKNMMSVIQELESFYSKELIEMKRFYRMFKPYRNSPTDFGCLEVATRAQLESMVIARDNRIVNFAQAIKKYFLTDRYSEFKNARSEEDFNTEKDAVKAALAKYYLLGFNETAASDEVVNMATLAFFGRSESYHKKDFCSIRLHQKRTERFPFLPPSIPLRELKKVTVPIFLQ